MTEEQLARAQRLWQKGVSTESIASICRVPESDVYNRIDKIKNTPAQPALKLVR